MLYEVITIIRPRFVLEVGTFTGYSALCLAAGLQPGGKLYTIDKNDELAPLSTRYFKEAGWEDRIELLTGDALEIIPTLQVQFDLVFLDGNKKEYLEYYVMDVNMGIKVGAVTRLAVAAR